MRISELIKELEDIQNKHGDLRIGCTASSPDEGYAYQVTEAYLCEDEDNSLFVDIQIDETRRPLN
jgi:hypothetical protein